jgi:hypothetical protein
MTFRVMYRSAVVGPLRRDVRPLGVDRRAAFEEILAAQLAHIEVAIHPS